MYLGLLLLGGRKIGAASVGNLWGQPWVWSSVVVLVVVILLMYVVGASSFYTLRDELAGTKDGKLTTSEELSRRLGRVVPNGWRSSASPDSSSSSG